MEPEKLACTWLVDKPKDWTSFDVVNKLRYAIRKSFDIKKIKVGHAGTLDPLATGLLIICVGKHTKRIESMMAWTKGYTGVIQLGATTPSYDLETEVDNTFPTDHITTADIEEVRLQFLGKIQQVPPIFSAIKIDGQRAYHLARKGETAELKTRTITIDSFSLDRLSEDGIAFDVQCSKGTYIRSLAHDFGKALQSGGYLASLRRTRIGSHSVEQAWVLEDLLEAIAQKSNTLYESSI